MVQKSKYHETTDTIASFSFQGRLVETFKDQFETNHGNQPASLLTFRLEKTEFSYVRESFTVFL